MGRAKIEKKDTLIDMTAMSDVAVLLLTFFMLTSTFVEKKSVQVTTPTSISEIKIPETDVLQIPVNQEGKIFISLDKQQDIRAVLENMDEKYGIKFTPEQAKRFTVASTFEVPIRSMQKFLDLPEDQRDKILKNEGIPCNSTDNQFKSWVRNARAANVDLRIAIRANVSTPCPVIKNVMNLLQDLRENRCDLITSLKTESENQKGEMTMSAEVQKSSGERGKGKQKKMIVRVNFTPMVDMNMLLITFFMLCTTLSKPQTMEISMSSNDEDITGQQKSIVKASQAVTLLLGADNKLYYYKEEPSYRDYISLRETDHGVNGLHAVPLQKSTAAVSQVRALKQQKFDLKITDDEYEKKVPEIKSGKNTPTIIIKTTDDASYMSLIDALDKTQICSIDKYVITDTAEADEFLIKNYDTRGKLSRDLTDK